MRDALALAGALPQPLRAYAHDLHAFDALVKGRAVAPSVRNFHVAARAETTLP